MALLLVFFVIYLAAKYYPKYAKYVQGGNHNEDWLL